MFTGFSMLVPPFTPCAFFAIPAELNPFLLDRTPYEAATNTHSRLAFTPPTPALAGAMVRGTKPARQPTDSHRSPFNIHARSSYCSVFQ